MPKQQKAKHKPTQNIWEKTYETTLKTGQAGWDKGTKDRGKGHGQRGHGHEQGGYRDKGADNERETEEGRAE